DAFTGEYVAEELKEDIKRRIAQIKAKYPKPPPHKPKKITPLVKRRGRAGGSKIRRKKEK
ncbi:MAG: C/D box methylation guide ribonucleoprotein complex aNOP56 subunit, partial [Candidatus Freyarchaeota archaeon]|nr:C/D box methylation guide ribonucleoprotein complex aNOP56 subunit [Candidatus Jordarchaeia archaeon]